MALTNDDKKFIVDTVKYALKEDRKYLKVYLDDLMDVKLGEKFKEKIGNLPTRDEFYEQMEKIHPDYTHVAFAS